jgi:hypothetical protein
MAVSPDHLAQWITWTGVAVAVIGAAEAAPDGSAMIWYRVWGGARRLRRWLAKFVPWSRGKPVTVPRVTGEGSMRMKGAAVAGTGYSWNPAAPDPEKIEMLFGMYQQHEQRIAMAERQAREQAEAIRADLRREIADIRGVTGSIIDELRQTEARSARADARGIVVVAGGILLTGLAAQLALCWPAAAVVMAAVIVIVVRVGYLVTRDWRSP